ncbi:hypothetical protein K439DRAFT_1639930 [Ramaria rubella]|nr:hypothetical protein K439DRAFT_1639930 [Ramaria rubella]
MESTTICSTHLATYLKGVKVKDTFTPPPFDNTLPYHDLNWHMDHGPNHRYATLLAPCDAVDSRRRHSSISWQKLTVVTAGSLYCQVP